MNQRGFCDFELVEILPILITLCLTGLIAMGIVLDDGDDYGRCERLCFPIGVAEFQPANPPGFAAVCKCKLPSAEVKP